MLVGIVNLRVNETICYVILKYFSSGVLIKSLLRLLEKHNAL